MSFTIDLWYFMNTTSDKVLPVSKKKLNIQVKLMTNPVFEMMIYFITLPSPQQTLN